MNHAILSHMKIKRRYLIHYGALAIALSVVWLTQTIPAWGEAYSRTVYPHIYPMLSALSGWVPFSLGDLFITLSIAGVIVYPIYGYIQQMKWKRVCRHIVTYLAWVYVWFYMTWGLNYAQYHFYQRTRTPYTAYSAAGFQAFMDAYICKLNASYVSTVNTDKAYLHQEIIDGYKLLGNDMGIHSPKGDLRVKTMMFTPLFSKMAITGYMGPFFCEFNLNGDLLPTQYAETYAHELAHLLGIASEAEANFYAYQVCTRSGDKEMRYRGYFSILGHVLNNAYRLLTEEEYGVLLDSIRPEILAQARMQRKYWMDKYSPTIGHMQSWVYDIYLKGNKIESGRKNYSEVIGLLISYELHHGEIQQLNK